MSEGRPAITPAAPPAVFPAPESNSLSAPAPSAPAPPITTSSALTSRPSSRPPSPAGWGEESELGSSPGGLEGSSTGAGESNVTPFPKGSLGVRFVSGDGSGADVPVPSPLPLPLPSPFSPPRGIQSGFVTPSPVQEATAVASPAPGPVAGTTPVRGAPVGATPAQAHRAAAQGPLDRGDGRRERVRHLPVQRAVVPHRRRGADGAGRPRPCRRPGNQDEDSENRYRTP